MHIYLATFGSQVSILNVKNRLDGFASYMGYSDSTAFDWSKLTYTTILAYRLFLQTKMKANMNQREAKGLQASSINTIMSALRGIAEVACNLGILSERELRSIKSIKPIHSYRKPAGRQLSLPESHTLFSEIDGTTPQGARDKAILGLMLGCGLRRAEIPGIELKNLDMEDGSLRLIGKGNKERKVFFTDTVYQLVANWLEFRGTEDGWLFARFLRGKKAINLKSPLSLSGVASIVRNRWDKASTKLEASNPYAIKPEKITPHDLRRTFATRLLSKNVDIVMVKELMGHANVTTTANYDRRTEEDIKRAARQMEI